MADPAGTITLSAALLAGLAGSAHCFTMCGGLASAFGMRARARSARPMAVLQDAFLHQAGRIGGYALAGGLTGAFGAALQQALDLSRIAGALRVASGILLMLVATRVLFSWNALRWLERLGGRFWSSLQPLVRSTGHLDGATRALLLGMLWGWLPCGLVYSMLLFAAFSGDALNGALIMIAFGVGTLPSMMTGTLLAARVHALLAQHWPKFVSGTLLMLFGLWMTLAVLQPQHAHHHG